MEINKPLNQYKMDQEQYLHEVGQNLADLFYNQKNINMKEETLEEAAENHLQKWRLLNNIHLSNILHAERCKNDFIAGAKWQQEQMEKLKDFDTWKEWKNTGIIKSE